VANGKGLVTTLSIFHMGLAPLPQPASTYPLLPLLLGWLGGIFDLERTAELLPEGLYLVSLTLTFQLIRIAVLRSRPLAARWMILGMAATGTAWLGLNPVYHWASSRPYTESLGMVLTLSTLLAYGAARAKLWTSAWTRGFGYAAIGMLAGMCYLTRFQLVVVVVAVCLSRLFSRGHRRIRDTVCMALGALPPMAWFAVRILSLPNAELQILFDFAKYRQLPTLPAFSYLVPCATASDWVTDKLSGVLAAFDASSSDSYVAQFGAVAWLAPVAAVVLLYRALRGWRPLQSWDRPRHAIWTASAAVGCLAVLPIHFVHSLHWHAWSFGWRQGLPLVFLLLPAAAWLLLSAGGVVGRWLVIIGFAFGIPTVAAKSLVLPERDPTLSSLAVRAATAAYLQEVALDSRTLGIQPQPLSAFTDAPLDWLACWSDPRLAEMLVAERGAERIVLSRRQLKCESVATLRPRLQLERRFPGPRPGDELCVYRIQPRANPSAVDGVP
jgi:hypothetical protein